MGLHLGDCLAVLPRLPAASVDMVFADLPYAITANRWDRALALKPLWAQLLRVAKPAAAMVFTCTQPFTTQLVCSQPRLFRYDLVWKRGNPTGFLQAKKQPMRNFENILVFYREQPTYNPQMTYGHAPYSKTASRRTGGSNLGAAKLRTVATVNTGSRYPTAIVECDASDLRGAWGNSKRAHPTQKPVALLQWLVATYSNPGDCVLDPTMGSGTTGVACAQAARAFVGIERNADYYNAAVSRIMLASGHA